MDTTTRTGDARACVVCLSCLNAGRALGVWISAEDAAAEIGDAITYGGQGEDATYPGGAAYVACKRCGGDEWYLADYEYLVPSMRTVRGFYESAEEWAEIEDAEIVYLFATWYDAGGALTVAELIDAHQDRYRGHWETFRDYAEQYAEDTGDLAAMPEHLARYIDWDAYARDLAYDYYEEDGHIWGAY